MGNNSYNNKKILSLIDRCLKKLNINSGPTRGNLTVLSQRLDTFGIEGPIISERYLDERIIKRLENMDEEETQIGLRVDYVNRLAAFIGFDTYEDFLQAEQAQASSPSSDSEASNGSPHPLEGSVGNWFSIVRCHSSLERMNVSPIKISKLGEGQFEMRMYGPNREYWGEITYQGTCMMALMTTKEAKQLYVELEVGIAATPSQTLLRGVYAGHTTAGRPSSGKEIFLRIPEGTPDNYIKTYRLNYRDPEDLEKHAKDLLHPWIVEYLSDYPSTVIKIPPASTYTLDDLAPST